MRKVGEIVQSEVLVVGGGVEGWLTANLLQQWLNQTGQERFKITLVEPKPGPARGLALEAPPSFGRAMNFIGVPERRLLAATAATFMHGTRFDGWRSGSAGFFHPFEAGAVAAEPPEPDYLAPLRGFLRHQDIDAATLWWHAPADSRGEFATALGVQAWLAEAHRAPKRTLERDYAGAVPYGYLLDEDLLAYLLAEHGARRLVHHVLDEVTQVRLDAQGRIGGVATAAHGWLTADFYVDCSGPAALLMGQALKVPWLPFTPGPPCDRELWLPLHGRADPPPFSTVAAAAAGWFWERDLHGAACAGYAYSSAHLQEEHALAELRARTAGRATGAAVRQRRLVAGRRAEFWRGNCAALGASAGVVAPLHGMALRAVEVGARALADLFVEGEPSVRGARMYDDIMGGHFDAAQEFHALHYAVSHRDDTPFWREARAVARMPPALAGRLELWQHYLPDARHLPASSPFGADDHRNLMLGMGWRPRRPGGRLVLREPVDIQKGQALLWAGAERALSDLPPQRELLAALHAQARPTELRTESLPLAPGIRLVGMAAEPSRLELSAGTATPEQAGVDPRDYHPQSMVPMPPWRKPGTAELGVLAGEGTQAGQGAFAAVVPVDPPLVAALRAAAERFQRPPGAHGEQLVTDANEDDELSRLLDRFLARHATPGMPQRRLGLLVNRSGWATITGDKFDDKRIGLHLDSWSQRPSEQRADAPNRICINAGREPRRLLLVNLPLPRILALLAQRKLLRPEAGATEIGQLFMRTFPDYPVLSIEVRPGEAYIAPTENTIHDGASDRMQRPDITYTVVGHFRADGGGAA